MPIKRIHNANLHDAANELARLVRESQTHVAVMERARGLGGSGDPLHTVSEFVRTHTVYRNDPPDLEVFVAPHIMLERIDNEGAAFEDCDSMSTLMAALLIANHKNVKMVFSDTNFDGETDHMYVICWSDRLHSWVPLDGTMRTLPVGYEPVGNVTLMFDASGV